MNPIHICKSFDRSTPLHQLRAVLLVVLGAALFSSPGASQTTYNFSSTTPETTIVHDLSLGSTVGNPPNTYNFAAGTYVPTSFWTFPCVNGNVFQGPIQTFTVGTGITPTAIIAPTYSNSNAVVLTGTNTYTSPGAGCTVQFLAAKNQNFYSQAPVSGLLFQFNRAYNILGKESGGSWNGSWAGFFVDFNASSISTTQDIGYSTFQWNTFGPSCSDEVATNNDDTGVCGGIAILGSNVNVTVQNNNVNGYISEFFHTFGQSSSGNTYGEISTNLLVQNNDLGGIHRIGIETQQETVTNEVLQYNDYHDPNNPYQGSAGISAACCIASAGSTNPPVPIANNNVVVQNSSCAYSYCLGYGIEAWGNEGTFNNNLVQNNAVGYGTIAFGGYAGGNSVSLEAINNTIQSTSSLVSGVVCAEGGTLPSCTDMSGTPVYSPNTVSSTISTLTSARPSVSPACGSYSSPQLITVTPNGSNTSSYCTTDGSSPVPNSGTTFLYTAPFSLPISGTTKVKCVGMWGVGANPRSYASGYGYVPSAQTIETYTASGTSGTCDIVTGSFGTNCYSATETLTGNNMHSNLITIGSQPVIPSSCTFYIGTPGQVGYHIVCGIVYAPTSTTEAATPDCYGVYTESSSTPSNSFVTVAMNNCPIEPAGTSLWVFENSNDDLVTLGYYNCGSSCTGTAYSGSYGGWYVSHTYNSYSGFPSSFNGQSTTQLTNFITVTPALVSLRDRWPHEERPSNAPIPPQPAEQVEKRATRDELPGHYVRL